MSVCVGGRKQHVCVCVEGGTSMFVCAHVCVCVYGEEAACLCVGEQFAHRAQEPKGLCWLLT